MECWSSGILIISAQAKHGVFVSVKTFLNRIFSDEPETRNIAKKKVLPQNAQNLQLKELSFFVAAQVNKKNVICKK